MARFSIAGHPLDIDGLNQRMDNARAGAFVCFEGRVRNHNDGHAVERLSYEVFHAMALTEGEEIMAGAIARFGLIDAQAVHRAGDLEIGACAVWVGVTATHRDEAFTACRAIIDEIKHRLPIWKKEFYTDGTHAWVNCQACGAHVHKEAAK